MEPIRNILARYSLFGIKPPGKKHGIGKDKPEEHPGDDRGKGPKPKEDRRHEGIGDHIDLDI